MSVDRDFYLKKKDKNMLFSIIFFIFIIVITLAIFFYNKILTSDIGEITQSLETKKNSIEEIKEDSNIQVKELLDINANAIDNLEKKTKVLDFIYHVKYISAKYDILFSAFNYANERVSLDAVIKTAEDGTPAYEKLRSFIADYRIDEDAKFQLDFISRFVGQKRISFHTDFIIK